MTQRNEKPEPKYEVVDVRPGDVTDSQGNHIGPELLPLVDAAYNLYPLLAARCTSAQIGVALDKTLKALLLDGRCSVRESTEERLATEPEDGRGEDHGEDKNPATKKEKRMPRTRRTDPGKRAPAASGAHGVSVQTLRRQSSSSMTSMGSVMDSVTGLMTVASSRR